MFRFPFNKIRYEDRYYWTFGEILKAGSDIEDFNLGQAQVLNVITYMLSEYGYTTSVVKEVEGSIVWDNANYGKVIDLVVKRFIDHYCFYTTGSEFSVDKQKNFIAKMITILEMTSPRYLKLLEVYASADAELLSPVEITSEGLTRFNDTPQDEGDFANDEHTTNLTQDSRTTTNDLDTKMGRIREIESNYNNLLLNWSNEFDSLFIEEENI